MRTNRLFLTWPPASAIIVVMLENTKLTDGGLKGTNFPKAFAAIRTNVERWHQSAVLYAEMAKNTKDLSAEETKEFAELAIKAKHRKQLALKSAKGLLSFCVSKSVSIEDYISLFSSDQYDAGFSSVGRDGDKAFKAKAETHIEDYTDLEEAIGAKSTGKTKKAKAGGDGEADHTDGTNWDKSRGTTKKTKLIDREIAFRTILRALPEQQLTLIWTQNDFLRIALRAKFRADRRYEFAKSTKKLILKLIGDYNPKAIEFPWLVGHHGPKGTNFPK